MAPRGTQLATLLLLATAALCALPLSGATCSQYGSLYLYVWAGSTNPNVSDSMITLRMCETGVYHNVPETFGEVWNVEQTGLHNLEPHHSAISADGRSMGAGGLLAALSGQPSVFFFDMSNPTHPKVLKNIPQGKASAIADAFLPIPTANGGGYLVTMMGSATGASPGKLLKYSNDLQLLAEFGPGNDTAFNPHGIAVDWKTGAMVTSDFIDPASTLINSPGLIARTTIRLWDVNTLTQTAVFDTSADGGVPGHPDTCPLGNGLFYASSLNGWLHLINSTASPPTITKVYNFGDALNSLPGAGGGLLKVFRNGTRVAVTSFSESKVMLLDASDPLNPTQLSEVAFGDGAGGHFVTVSTNERLMAVATYFLDEGAAGTIRFPGDQTVRFILINADATVLTAHPNVPLIDFKRFHIDGQIVSFRPHGLAFSPQ